MKLFAVMLMVWMHSRCLPSFYTFWTVILIFLFINFVLFFFHFFCFLGKFEYDCLKNKKTKSTLGCRFCMISYGAEFWRYLKVSPEAWLSTPLQKKPNTRNCLIIAPPPPLVKTRNSFSTRGGGKLLGNFGYLEGKNFLQGIDKLWGKKNSI